MTSKQARGVPAEVGRSFGPGRLDELADVRSRTCTSDALGLRHALVGDDAGGRRLVCRCRSARVGNGSRHRRPRSVPPAGGRPRRFRTPSATPRTIAITTGAGSTVNGDRAVARRLHGSTKLAGEGRLWMMCCAPLISIVAQSVSIAVILPPEMR